MEERQIRGLAILAKGDNPISVKENEWIIPSQSSNRKYKVQHADIWSCECPDFQNRRIECKHIHAIRFLQKVQAKDQLQDFDIEDAMDTKKCPYCSSTKLVKNATRKTRRGIIQRIRCKECHRRFIEQPMKYIKADAKIVCLTMDLYYKGLSLRDISDTLHQFYGITVHFDTVRRWIQKFTEKMNEYTNTMKPKTGGIVHTDEQMIKSKGEFVYAWNTIDRKTRFVLASTISRGRGIGEARAHFKEVKANSDKDPFLIITDSLGSYPRAIKKEFKTMRKKTEHLSIVGRRKERDNNLIERYHNDFREFDKVRRGFKSDETTQEWANGFRLYHNFIHENPTIGKTPAEEAGIHLGLKRNKWKSLLDKSMTPIRQEATKNQE